MLKLDKMCISKSRIRNTYICILNSTFRILEYQNVFRNIELKIRICIMDYILKYYQVGHSRICKTKTGDSLKSF